MFDRRLALLLLTGCNAAYGLDDLSYSEERWESPPSTSEGAGSGGSMGGAGGAPVLVDNGLVARYFIDDTALPNEVVTTLADATDDETLALNIDYGTPSGEGGAGGAGGAGAAGGAGGAGDAGELPLSLTGDDGFRALSWNRIESNARASAEVRDVPGNKLHSELDGKEQATLETVVKLDQVSSQRSRIVHFGSGGEGGRLSLGSWQDRYSVCESRDGTPGVDAFWNYKLLGCWPVPFNERVVLHLVIDTRAPSPDDKTKLYCDGIPVRTIAIDEHGDKSEPASGGLDLRLDDDNLATYLVLGNREIGARSFIGELYYAAVYNKALTESEVETNAELLLERDDP